LYSNIGEKQRKYEKSDVFYKKTFKKFFYSKKFSYLYSEFEGNISQGSLK